MAHPMGESETGVLRLDFDRRLKLEFHGSKDCARAAYMDFHRMPGHREAAIFAA